MVVLSPHGVSGTYGQLYMAHEPTLYALHITVLQRLTFYRDTKLWVHDHISTPTVVIKMERLNVIKIASIPLCHTTYQYHSILIKINIKYRYDTGKYSSLAHAHAKTDSNSPRAGGRAQRTNTAGCHHATSRRSPLQSGEARGG